MKITIKKQRLFFISLIGIVVVSLIMGTTFAYQTINVEKTEGSSTEMTVNVGKLNVTYTKNTENISLSNMPLLPNYKAAEYVEFRVAPNDSTENVAFKVNLMDIDYGYLSNGTKTNGCGTYCLASSDFKYTLVEVNDGVESIVSEGDFSSLSSTSPYTTELVLSNEYLELSTTQSKTLRLYLWLQETSSNQNSLENTYFQAKVNIVSIFASEVPKTLAEAIIESAQTAVSTNDSTRTLYNDTFNLNSITRASSSSDRMLALAEDDYGTSYVFRGNVIDNYVSFAGFTWRIVRINGDGSVRLILDGSLDKVTKDGETSPVYTNSALTALDSDGKVSFKSSPYKDNAYIGYMYGTFTTSSTSYDEAHSNNNNSTIKTYIDKFYEQYLLNYKDYLADTIFCGDKTLAKSTIGSSNMATGFGTGTGNATYYAAAERLDYKTGTTYLSLATPSLKCASSDNDTNTLTESQRAYSRYTSKIDTSESTTKGVLVNNDLTYPIALLSADELIMAGAWRSTGNFSYYLYDAYSSSILSDWWTMTPSRFDGSYVYNYNHNSSLTLRAISVSNPDGVRPVINLRADVLIDKGDGTTDTEVGEGPYAVLLP